jgi:predicted nucleic acid-binding protein
MCDQSIEQAIQLRQQKRMKLGDAIIAATAVAYNIPRVIRNVDDFKHIPGLDLRNPFVITS